MDWLNNPVTVSLSFQENVPVEECRDIIESDQLVEGLKKAGYSFLFPVQAALLKNFAEKRDYGVIAPTGSGKTLTFIIPIIKSLMGRKIIRLRALVIVPTRLLAVQALAVIQAVIDATPGCKLKAGCATGKTALSREQREIFDATERKSKVDILVCTPGRLVEHIRQTPDFSLLDLKFLVIDEADRLLEQEYQDWLELVVKSTEPDSRLPNPFGHPMEDVNWRGDLRLTKIILSASLTKRPAQLLHLRLDNPLLIKIVHGAADAVQMPAQMSHFYLAMPEGKKPIAALFLLKHTKLQDSLRTLIFANTSSSTAKLARFLKDCKVACFFVTAETDSNVSKNILADFASGKTNVLVASDCLARGIDVPNIEAVINYDCPATVALYTHRAGRTARAGNTGSCYTILAPREAKHFKSEFMPAISNMKRIRPEKHDLESLSIAYKDALDL